MATGNNWEQILLNLWESNDTYHNKFVTIEVQRSWSHHYQITDNRGNTYTFSNYKKAVRCLESLGQQSITEIRER